MKSSVFSHKKMNFGFTLIELMTALIIILLLALVGLPMYQEYQVRSHMAEADSVVGTMERHAVAYLLDHGSFYSASPSPAFVPGINSAGDTAAFSGGADWSTIGLPVSTGSDVVFSYQAFAGQTPAGSTTFVTNTYLHSPTENMNLERGASVAVNDVFPNPVAIAAAEEKIRFDWSDFNFCSSAQEAPQAPVIDSPASCYSYCIGIAPEPECRIKCNFIPDGTTETEEQKKLRCVNSCGGDSGNACFQDCFYGTGSTGGTACVDQCVKGGAPAAECTVKCGGSTGGSPTCVESCLASGGSASDCDLKCGIAPADDGGKRERECNIACRGQRNCSDACSSGDEHGESDTHKKMRCHYSCGGDSDREARCNNGEDDGDEGSCESKCHGDGRCISACNDNDHNACEASCKGDHACLENCQHHSCQSSCFGDHNCLKNCKENHCHRTCGGHSDEEQRCNDDVDGDDGGDHCVRSCVEQGRGGLSECRTECNHHNGDDDDGGSCNGHHCPRHQRWDGELNQCVDDGTGGHTCPAGQTWNVEQNKCVTSGGGGTCPSGQVWNGSQCVTDTSCPSGQTWNGSSCVTSGGGGTCTPPQVWNGSSCVNPTPTCPSGQYWNGSACVSSTPTCPSGQTWNGTACVATTGGGTGTPNGECASFGVSAPVDFGIPTGVAGLDYVVFSGVANLKRGSECTLYVKKIIAINKQVNRSEAALVLNRGE